MQAKFPNPYAKPRADPLDASPLGPPRPFSDRLALGAVLGPLAALPASLLVATFLVLREFGPRDLDLLPGLVAVLALHGTLLSYGVTLIYGVPVLWLLNRVNLHGLPTTLVLSVLPLVAILWFLTQSLPEVLQRYPYLFFSLAVGGTLWWIVLRPEP